MNRRHPLPWTLQNDWITLTGEARFDGDEDRPYSLGLGRYGGTLATLTRDELQQLREQIDAVLAAPFRVLVPNPCEHDEPWLANAIRERLDALHATHPNFEIAMLDIDALDSAPITWSMDARVPVLFYQTTAELFADGGSRVLLVAGPNGPELSRQAHEQRLAVQLIRGPRAVA